ncbi:MAG TPA: zinc-binding dehydrogenase [Nocardioides sp.]|uniref:quinone oxidoreductase family protein n=1 Tax=Nocardioides sp. TaxID=35761 RepID=UPI002E3417F8|nr:zinc-binding dehydrogenase [Nocardioides sp.]HEX5086194.1 zinc-binding dehydrogenase [Nocardioides sp.]
MRAVEVREFGAAEVLQVVERPEPVPGEGEISIDVAFAGVGLVDMLMRRGDFPLSLPLVPGIEVTGHVRAVPAGGSGFSVGDPVVAVLNDFGRTQRLGGYAEVAVAHATMAARLAGDADLARIAAVAVNGVTAWLALRELARLTGADRVLVLGAGGGLGATCARVAVALGAAQVIGVVGRDVSRAPAECSAVVLADELEQRWVTLTGDGLVDVVVDPVGGALREAAFSRLAPLGRHLVLGDASGDDRGFPGDGTWLASRMVMGLNLGGTSHLRPDLVSTALSAVVDLVANGVLAEPAPHVVPLEGAVAVHRGLEDRTAPTKTVLAVRGH